MGDTEGKGGWEEGWRTPGQREAAVAGMVMNEADNGGLIGGREVLGSAQCLCHQQALGTPDHLH